METSEHKAREVKFALADTAGEFEGYASLFGGEPDRYGDVIEPGAFTASLARHKAEGSAPVLLWAHDPASPIGKWLSMEEDQRGLKVRGRLILDSTKGAEAYALLKGEALNGLSIGYRVLGFERLPSGGRKLTEIDILEVSLVTLPAASRARVTSVKSAPADNPQGAMGAPAAQEDSMSDQDVKDAPAAPDVSAEVKALAEEVKGLKEANTRLETKLNRPGAGEAKDAPKPEAKAFNTFLRKGREALGADEVKDLRTSPDPEGGYLAPDQFVNEIVKNLVEVSPVRQAARVMNTTSGSVRLPKRTGEPTASWVGETEDRSETQPAYGMADITVHEMACYIDVSNAMLEDAAFNIESELATDLAEEFGQKEGAAFISGDGNKKPFGFLTDSDIPFTKSGNGSTLGSAPADKLIELFYGVKAPYRNRGVWMMNGSLLAEVRKFKDGQSNYIWRPALAEGQPETILGRPVVEAPDMPDVEANAFPIAFGDFNAGYRIVDRVSLSLLRDPYSQATKGLTRFHARRRVGGAVVKSEALRFFKIAS